MSSSPSEHAGNDPLEPVLRDVEAELRNRLREACEAEASGVPTENAVEIRRLEDSLLAAVVAAEQAIALRRRIDQRKSRRATAPAQLATRSTSAPNDPSDFVLKVREFRDQNGQLWRAWPVIPGQARPGRTAERYLGEFHKGWICFEALEGSARRRLPRQPEHWAELQDSDLRQLLEQAVSAPQRTPRTQTGERQAPPSVH